MRARHATSAPWGLLGMLALATAIETGVVANADRLAGYDGLSVRFAVDAATRKAPECDVLSVGDSVVKFGFDPGVIEDRLGLKAYNLAVPGTPPPLAYAVFRRALDAGAKPKALIVGQMTLSGDPKAHTAQFGEFAAPTECLKLAWSCRDGSLFGGLLAARGIPSIRYRQALRAALQGDLIDVPPATRWQVWAANRGAELRPPGEPSREGIDDGLAADLSSTHWQVDRIFERYLRRLTDLAHAEGITVFWIVPPIAPEIQARRDALGLDADHTRNLRRIHAMMSGVVVLDARRARYDRSDFFDPIHLNARGARRLSTEIADAIADHLGRGDGPLWVDLPRRDGPSDRIVSVQADPVR